MLLVKGDMGTEETLPYLAKVRVRSLCNVFLLRPLIGWHVLVDLCCCGCNLWVATFNNTCVSLS
jgi:hypothetical protein